MKKTKEQTREEREKELTDKMFFQGRDNTIYHITRKINKRIDELEKINGINELKRLKKEILK